MPTSEQILTAAFNGFFIGFIVFGIGIILYLAITSFVNEYRWWKLKRHLIEAIEALDLWDAIKTHVLTGDLYKSITMFLDAHKYRHCFHESGGAFWLAYALSEIRSKREKENI